MSVRIHPAVRVAVALLALAVLATLPPHSASGSWPSAPGLMVFADTVPRDSMFRDTTRRDTSYRDTSWSDTTKARPKPKPPKLKPKPK